MCVQCGRLVHCKYRTITVKGIDYIPSMAGDKMSSWESEMTPEDWKIVMEQAIKALENMPEVGEVYDQQHSDTQMAAVLQLKGMMKWASHTCTYLK
jgi:hypothetical protein